MLLSILIRNLNEAFFLDKLLQTIMLQKTDFEYETVIVDNESTDHSISVIQQYNCKLISMPQKDFSYGGSLNLGLRHCKGEFVLIISPHIILLHHDFLQRIPPYFINYPSLAGLRFIQNFNTNDIISSYYNNLEKLEYAKEKDFYEKNNLRFIVNHCSAIRKSVWKQLPFDESLIACEDKRWSLDVLKKGFSIFYKVPCFYAYINTLNKEQQVLKTAREIISFELINNRPHPEYNKNATIALLYLIKTALYSLKNKVVTQRKVYSTIKKLKQK